MFLVPDALWVVANFKETQTAHMQAGQPVVFEVDALKGARLTGHIDVIAPATGSEFSVLRADNASGNFTKVVQRLQVRTAIHPGQALAARLRPGMSVVAQVDTAVQGQTQGQGQMAPAVAAPSVQAPAAAPAPAPTPALASPAATEATQ